MTLVGALGGARLAEVDGTGTLRPERVNWELAWWIGADDRWHFPHEEVAVRQSLLDGMPVVVTAMRVPGGDAVQRVYATPDATIVEIANESRAPFVVAVVVSGALQLATDRASVVVDRRVALVGNRPASRWAVSTDGRTRQLVASGAASDGDFVPRTDRAARLDAAFLHPAAHGARVRFALPLQPDAGVDRSLATGADAVARGWRVQLARGMQVTLPDASLQQAVDTARAQLLLAGQAWIVAPEVVAALEDWGFDAEAATAWKHLGVFARRKASRRSTDRAAWDDVRSRARRGDADFLLRLRTALVSETGGTVDLLASWPHEWRGFPIDVRGAPTKLGPVSYSTAGILSVALLWEAPPNATMRIPAVDPAWSTAEPRGETLLTPAA
ncbi:MAG TPA: hypothetical protein VEP49_01200 [Acidimicrobiia bacterium]|nr:hypothetical protein [Acidimicrobiia bacterium]